MSQETSDGSTVGWSGTGGLGPGRAHERTTDRLPALTVLYHPDLRRIGHRVLLPGLLIGREVLVSRYEPELAAPGEPAGEPLSDIYISRRPIVLRYEDGGVEIQVGDSRTAVAAQGISVFQSCRFQRAELERGIVLELSGRVVLLLHLMEIPPRQMPPQLGLVGDSSGLVRVRTDIQRIADLEVPVLLRGETGTGKELAAQAIHQSSPRRDASFLAVNLGAVPASLSASELFGAVKGAFTGSVGSQEGYFRRAHGGTLLLDEIGEAPPEVQVMLLRVIEAGEMYPVGSQTPVRVDVRVIAATDADLEDRVRSGAFRGPLFHRLAGYEVWMPPLRERRDDIGRLLLCFLRQELQRIGEEHRLDIDSTACDPLWLPPRLVSQLARYDWPGNVRQLRNVVRQLVIGSRGLPRLEIGPQVARLLQERPDSAVEVRAPSSDETPPPAAQPPARRRPGEVTEEEVIAALRVNRWDIKATAEALRVSRTSLYALMESSPRIRRISDLSAEEIARCHDECGGNLDAMVERLEVSKRSLGRRLRELGLA